MNNQLPADIFIKAAADLSGRDPGQLDAREALHILQEYGRQPAGNVYRLDSNEQEPASDLYRQLTDDAANELFSDPQHAAEWADVVKEWDGETPDLLALTLQRDLSPIIRAKARKMYDDLPQDDPQRQELENIMITPALSPEMQETLNSVAEALRPMFEGMTAAAQAVARFSELIQGALPTMDFGKVFGEYTKARELIDRIKENHPIFALYDEMQGDLAPYIEEELKNPQYGGKKIEELIDEAEESDDGLFSENSLLMQAVKAARAAKAIEAQKAGRELRRQLRKNAESKGAIMELRNDGALPIFSANELRDAFSPGRISQMGKLAPDTINKQTGRVEKAQLEKGDIVPLPAANISYKALLLLNAITANSVENYRQFLVSGGAIRFYVKGVLDQLEIETRHWDDPQQITLDGETLDRKTTGVLYLEKQLKPLQMFVGTTPDGSRYSVLNYEGYDIESDTMTIRSPYLFQLWKRTQTAFAERQRAKEQRIADGKKPLKADLKPLELNTLFKRSTYKEDDAVLEIAVYITNVLLNAGKGAHKTRIKYKTLINNCPRLRERLEEIARLPKAEKLANGKTRNNTARYNTELRKIARAYTLIMTPDKCDALKHFKFIEFSPTIEKGGRREFVAPTKSTIDGEIFINWRRIDPENA